jgi:hypothetical protein
MRKNVRLNIGINIKLKAFIITIMIISFPFILFTFAQANFELFSKVMMSTIVFGFTILLYWVVLNVLKVGK